MNVLNGEVTADVVEVLKEIKSNPSITSAVLISGKPGCFIAGADISMLSKLVQIHNNNVSSILISLIVV